ncbi:MAG: OmpH family outer membrane protein [Desulfobacteraceae bacterium]|nr:MAG: OmpH family outer membrane protein [Desulfobacteraceae bacterium]
MRIGRWGGMFGAVAVMMLIAVSAGAADGAKIGIVDFQKVLTDSETGKKIQAQMQEKGKGMEAKLIAAGKEIETLAEQMSREAMVMSKEKREEKQRELEIKKYDFQSLQKKFQMEFREEEGKQIEKIKKEIFDMAAKIGEKDGYMLIIEKSAVIYSPKSVDITGELIKEYDSGN